MRVLGRVPNEGEPSEKSTLIGKLLDLDATVKAAKPVSDALVQCKRLKQHLKNRRDAEIRLAAYAVASAALRNLAGLGSLPTSKSISFVRLYARMPLIGVRGFTSVRSLTLPMS